VLKTHPQINAEIFNNSAHPVINCSFTKVIDIDIVIDTHNKSMTKVVDTGFPFTTGAIDNDDKYMKGDVDNHK